MVEAGTLAITKNKPDNCFGCRSENFKTYIRLRHREQASLGTSASVRPPLLFITVKLSHQEKG